MSAPPAYHEVPAWYSSAVARTLVVVAEDGGYAGGTGAGAVSGEALSGGQFVSCFPDSQVTDDGRIITWLRRSVDLILS